MLLFIFGLVVEAKVINHFLLYKSRFQVHDVISWFYIENDLDLTARAQI